MSIRKTPLRIKISESKKLYTQKIKRFFFVVGWIDKELDDFLYNRVNFPNPEMSAYNRGVFYGETKPVSKKRI